MALVKQWMMDFIGLLFPNLCGACGIPLVQHEQIICIKCIYDLPYTDYHLHPENRVAKQLWGRLPIESAMSMLYFRKASKVQQLIHNLKYNNKKGIGVLLGELLGERLRMNTSYAQANLIIPVPLHQKRLRQRGYNQSTCIAEGLSQKMDIPFSEKQLLRNRSTNSQTHKNRYNRYENMKDVFSTTNPEHLLNQHILLIDDVLTTGATLEACALVLLENGASKISIATLAFAE